MVFSKNKKLGISTKTSIISGIIVLILLAGSSIVSINLQSSSSRLMINNFTQTQGQELKEYEIAQNKLIEESTKITLEICSSIAEAFIYDFDPEGLKELLASFVKTDSIVAIKVLDVDDQPFAAAWKEPEIKKDDNIPPEISL